MWVLFLLLHLSIVCLARGGRPDRGGAALGATGPSNAAGEDILVMFLPHALKWQFSNFSVFRVF